LRKKADSKLFESNKVWKESSFLLYCVWWRHLVWRGRDEIGEQTTRWRENGSLVVVFAFIFEKNAQGL
jgi:hypothetical protein